MEKYIVVKKSGVEEEYDETEPLSQEAVDHFWECLFLFAHAINDTNSDIIRFVEDNTDG
jgi:exopolyphosphatase/pppGpp-phosphohydrolase